jgi:mannosyltransferase
MVKTSESPEMPPGRPDLREGAWLAGVLLLALALRLYRLGHADYWQDEVFMLLKSENLHEVLTSGNFVSNHPPLFALLAAVWRMAGLGETEFMMRLLPALLGVAGIGAAWLLGRRFFSPRAGLIAAFLIALSPFHIHHSQDLKDYILLPFTGTLMALAFYEARETGRKTWWAAYALLAGAACYSDVHAGPLLIALNGWFLVTLRGRYRLLLPWFIANGCGFLLFVPYLGIMLPKALAIMVDCPDWWLPPPDLWSVVFYLKALAFGYSDFEPLFKIALALFLAAVSAGAALAWKHDRDRTLFLLAWIVVPITLVFCISHVTESIFLIRALLPYAVPFYLLAAVAIASFSRPLLRGAALGLAAALAVVPIAEQAQGIYPELEFPHRPGIHTPQPFAEAADWIRENRHDGDILIHPCNDPSYMPMAWYGLFGMPQYHGEVSEDFIAFYYRANPITMRNSAWANYYPVQLQPLLEDRDRVWFVFYDWERILLPGYPLGVWRWLDAKYAQTAYRRFGWLEVYLFERARAGVPVETAVRGRDNGVTAKLTYRGGVEGQYTWRRPDAGLVPSPPEARAGRLLLAFDGPAENAYTLENRSTEQVRCRVMALASAALIDLASLYEEDPDSDCWHVRSLHNPDAPPENFSLTCAVAEVKPDNAAALTGRFALPDGAYDTQIFMLGTPFAPDRGRAGIRITLNGEPVIAPRDYRDSAAPFAWNWLRGRPVTVTGNGETQLRVMPSLPEGLDRAWADSAALALMPPDGTPPNGTVIPLTPGEITLAPGETRRFIPPVPEGALRLDVWVLEYGEDGRGYRIFRKF